VSVGKRPCADSFIDDIVKGNSTSGGVARDSVANSFRVKKKRGS
jgi:hypothetical protein